MFIGHFAVGFAAKRLAPRTSLATLLAATMFLDLLWPIFLLFGWEQVRIDPGNTRFTPLDFVHYPWSHSLVMSGVWATAFALIYYTATKYWRGTLAIWIGVVSHWVLDWITHRRDMPIYPSGPKAGLGLWNSIAGTVVVEVAIFLFGVWIYARATRPRDRIGRYGFVAYGLLLILLYMANIFSGAPPGILAIALSAIALGVVLIPWAWWFDHHRDPLDGNRTIASRQGTNSKKLLSMI
ncbi:MAG TPA: hypothetical protein VG498_13020 [Terriglobales bacterium]|nr:hypothetical protein [Terriglobales bacterium]